MRILRRAFDPRPLLLLGAALFAACDDPAEPPEEPCIGPTAAGLCIDVVATGLRFPLALEQPQGDDRVFVAEQAGRIRIIRDHELLPQPFLDITADVYEAPEQGLIGMAFHPDFASNGHVFVAFTGTDEDVHVERFTVGSDPDRLDPATRKEILVAEREAGPHSGGQLVFGPDGMLWMGIGDANIAWTAQDSTTLFGSLLRIDVDGGDPYAIPAGNPYADVQGARGEIWATGLRNPWRFSFHSGRLIVADVGQSEWEELNVVSASEPGLDYGWPMMEARACFGVNPCDPDGLVLPSYEYDHTVGCSIIGGEIYRGTRLPALSGRYLFGDFCGWIASATVTGMEVTNVTIYDFDTIPLVNSFGFDPDGEPWVLFHNGDVARIVAAPEPTG